MVRRGNHVRSGPGERKTTNAVQGLAAGKGKLSLWPHGTIDALSPSPKPPPWLFSVGLLCCSYITRHPKAAFGQEVPMGLISPRWG